ncbi:MAG: hypothetical protein MUO40_13425 [Anaerolineaceae bacterium]|nr:hypothetical protein [Anaerolineaceae bacterium]
MNRISFENFKYVFLSFILLLVLTACGKNIDSLTDDKDVQGLIDILNDSTEEGWTRKDAAFALGAIGDPAAVEPLVQYLWDCAQTMRAHSTNDDWQACSDSILPVSQIIGRLGDANTLGTLTEMLENQYLHDEAVTALGLLNNTKAILPLIESIDHALGMFDEVTKRLVDVKPVALSLAANDPGGAFDLLKDALPGFHEQTADKCLKYRIALDALVATQDPRLEELLLSLIESYDADCEVDIPGRLAELWEFDAAKLLPYIKLSYDHAYSADFAGIYFSPLTTPKPKAIDVDFVSFYDYPPNTEVTITGLLSTPEIFVCKTDCYADLRNPLDNSEMIGISLLLGSQISSMPNPYTEKNFQVRLSNGEWVGHNTLVQLTGTISGWPTSIFKITNIELVN